jgi:transposase
MESMLALQGTVFSFIVPNRQQHILMTEVDLDSLVPADGPLQIIDELVNALDTSGIEEQYDLESEQGQNPIHPKTLLKVALFTIHNCRFSLRKTEEDTRYRLGYKWLTGDRSIDHSTMGRFLARFRNEIPDLFSQVVSICVEKGLVNFDLLAIDSVKLRANASYKHAKNLEGLSEEEQKLKEKPRELLNGVGTGQSEQDAAAIRRRRAVVREAKQTLSERIREKAAGRSAREAEELKRTEKINLTDPDSRIMEQANGERNPVYSVTTAADAGSDIITHFQLNAEDRDAQVLLEAIEGSRESTGKSHKVVAADAGFASKENYEQREERGQEALVHDRRLEAEREGETAKGAYDRGKFLNDAGTDSYRCPAGKRLEKLGKVMLNGRKHYRYGNSAACRSCPHREQCTKGNSRLIFRDGNEAVVERMQDRLSKRRNAREYRRRAHTSEAPYGNAKRNLKFLFLMRRVLEKVRMELALLFMHARHAEGGSDIQRRVSMARGC